MNLIKNEVEFPVMEHFYTIQGEGYHSGSAAYFIRLGGCDVGCVWCDVKESWDAHKHQNMSVGELIKPILEMKAIICVITGGEPTMYNLHPLVDALKTHGVRVHLETSGAYPIQGHFDWVCLSPKKFKFPIKESLQIADEYKPVVFNKSDIAWAETYIKELKPECKLFLQPEWSKAEGMVPLIINYVKENPHWQISLQSHKYLNIP